jgi:outer membrane protein
MGGNARRSFLAAAAPIALLLSIGSAKGATTLADAIAEAYQSNPTLQAQRAQLRAVDESYVQARAGLGPNVQFQGTEYYDRNDVGAVPGLPAGQLGANTLANELEVSQLIYSGGKGAADLRAAEAHIRAGREQLRSTEASVLFQTISAYADVLRDQQSLAVRRQHLDMLAHELDVAKSRQTAGEATLTDVAQAQAELEAERALVTSSSVQLNSSRAAYAAVVGDNPTDLADPPDFPGLPSTVDDAFRLAEADNPDLRQAEDAEEESREQVVAARAAFRPTISVGGAAIYSNTTQPFFGRSESWDFNGQATLSIPLFTNGARSSAVRQAVDRNASDRVAIDGARRNAVQNVANAWNGMLGARSNVTVEQQEVKFADFAFHGMQIEYGAGQRSTFDVLLAEQTLRNAQISLITAQHDAFVASAALLRAIGKLEARNLVSSLPAYDPVAHFNQVRNRGAAPWTGLVEGIDSIASPSKRVPAVPAPPLTATPQPIVGAPPPADAPMVTAVPTFDKPPATGVR